MARITLQLQRMRAAHQRPLFPAAITVTTVSPHPPGPLDPQTIAAPTASEGKQLTVVKAAWRTRCDMRTDHRGQRVNVRLSSWLVGGCTWVIVCARHFRIARFNAIEYRDAPATLAN
jgi:hypothetical protein